MKKEIKEHLSNKPSFEVTVKTNQKKNDLQIIKNKPILLIKEKPENNKANKEIERFLSKILGREAKIIKGKTSKNKTIKLT